MAEGTLGQETEDLPTSPLNRQPSVTLGVPGVPSSRVGAPRAPFMLALFRHECTYGHHIVRKKSNHFCKKPHSPQQKTALRSAKCEYTENRMLLVLAHR